MKNSISFVKHSDKMTKEEFLKMGFYPDPVRKNVYYHDWVNMGLTSFEITRFPVSINKVINLIYSKGYTEGMKDKSISIIAAISPHLKDASPIHLL